MIKKKSFWLILLAILTAAVMVFCACGLVGCSSESDEDDDDDNDNTQQGGGTGGGSTEDDGSFTVWGITNLFGSWWSSYTFDPDGTGFFALYNEDGSLESHSSDITNWYYIDDTHIKGTIHITRDEDIDITLMKVDGKVVAASVYTVDYDSEDYFYETSVLGALDSTDDIGGSPAQLVLYKDFSSVAVIGDAISYGEWAWTTEGASLTVTIGTDSYSATVTDNGHDQIIQAVFDKFDTASNVTFIQMGTVDATLYSFVSEEGYTLVMDKDGNFETVVDGTTYTGQGSTTTLALADDENDTTYTPTLEKDSDGNVISVTYDTYFGGKTDVVFLLPENVDTTYNDWYNDTVSGNDRGEAVAVFNGIAVTNDESDTAVQSDDVEYWLFLYRDGTFTAHIYANFPGYGKTDGSWTWGTNAEDELVPVFTRNPGQSNEQVNYATKNTDGTYSVAIENSASRTTDAETGESVLTGAYYVYTFSLEDMPAGVFEGSTENDETTYVIILYGDGTFRCHVPQTGAMPQYGTSTGFWSKDENGDMKFYKTSSGSISALCEVTAQKDADGNETGKLEVQITNSQGTVYTYVVDPSIVPVGGHTYTDEDNAKIAELEAAT